MNRKLERIQKIFNQLNPPPPKTYVLEFRIWGSGKKEDGDEDGFGSIYWLMENDESKKGRFIRGLTKEEADGIRGRRVIYGNMGGTPPIFDGYWEPRMKVKG